MAEPRTSAGRDLRRHLFPKITPFVMQKVTEHIIAIEIEAYELGCAATASALRSTPAAPLTNMDYALRDRMLAATWGTPAAPQPDTGLRERKCSPLDGHDKHCEAGLDVAVLSDAMRYGYAWTAVPFPDQWHAVARAVAAEYRRHMAALRATPAAPREVSCCELACYEDPGCSCEGCSTSAAPLATETPTEQPAPPDGSAVALHRRGTCRLCDQWSALDDAPPLPDHAPASWADAIDAAHDSAVAHLDVDRLARALVFRRYGINVESANPADVEDADAIAVEYAALGDKP